MFIVVLLTKKYIFNIRVSIYIYFFGHVNHVIVRRCQFFDHVQLLTLVVVKHFRSCSNQNSVIFIWSCALASKNCFALFDLKKNWSHLLLNSWGENWKDRQNLSDFLKQLNICYDFFGLIQFSLRNLFIVNPHINNDIYCTNIDI